MAKRQASRGAAHSTSSLIEAARSTLGDVTGKQLAAQERIEMAIDLAGVILTCSQSLQTSAEKKIGQELCLMMQDPAGKAFVASMLDSCFRTADPKRLIDQVLYLLSRYGTPAFVSREERWGFYVLRRFGRFFPKIFSHLLKDFVQKKVKEVIAPGEDEALNQDLRKWQKEKVKINLNRLGEAILGEYEAKKRFEQNLQDLANPLIKVISVKITSICSQLNLLAYQESLRRLKARLRLLYRTAQQHQKFVNLDMEEYKDLQLTVQLFQEVLSEPEFLNLSAGIALQSYLPDSHAIQVQLTEWAMQRCLMGGAPIKIRLVKGANLGMERVEASLKEWPQATYPHKSEVDASFIKMMHFGLQKAHCEAVHLGIGSHNLFDIAYACLLASEHEVEAYVDIEMLAGMAPHIARAMQQIWPNVLLYLPCAKKDEFHTSIAYLMRRLDENTAPGNFLTHLFGLQTTSDAWREQEELFALSCYESQAVATVPRRTQNRKALTVRAIRPGPFSNEPDTDFSAAPNRIWAEEIIREWQINYHEVLLSIAGNSLVSGQFAQGIDPSRPGCKIHTYFLAEDDQVEAALECAKDQAQPWANTPLQERLAMIRKAAQNLRRDRKRLIGAMLQEAGKIIPESDSEVSEAIDFCEYYTKEVEATAHAEKIFSVGKVALVVTPWNFPVSIPCSALVSSLLSGYSVIFKPAPEAVLSGWLLAHAFWHAGVPQQVLQFITCSDDPIGTKLVNDPRVDCVILTGGTSTARFFLQKRPSLRLFGETGGKNSLIVTALSDRDLAVKDAVYSAFGYAGQKCSACSLLILEEEVYHDKNFREQLLDAASHLPWGQSYQPSTIVNPLIRPPGPHLLKALSTLEEGESWLLKPKQDPQNPQSWSPGIKYGVKPGSFTHQTELFGPHLSVICAKNLEEAICIANGTPYGLTAGLHSLDPREHLFWKRSIVAGNLYINRAITGAIVARQPFGGTKASSFGVGMKVGGPNYLLQLGNTTKIPPLGQHAIAPELMDLEGALNELGASQSEQEQFYKAVCSMIFWWDNYFSRPRTLRRLIGQDNILEFECRSEIYVLFQDHDSLVDMLLVLAGARVASCKVICGASFKQYRRLFRQGPLAQIFERFQWQYLSAQELVDIIRASTQVHLRALQNPPDDILQSISTNLGCLDVHIPSPNGRLELIHYVREVATSSDYHRYGNLMDREQEFREPVK